MTRTEALASIAASLDTMEDEDVIEFAEKLASKASILPRELTDDELALIEQSREDFRLGRTMSLEEAEAETIAFLAERRRLHAAE